MNDLSKINKMNVYLNVEISSRELDSKLLLAVLAAARGHQVVISSTEIIEKGLKRSMDFSWAKLKHWQFCFRIIMFCIFKSVLQVVRP